jgi:transcriptional regulator with XRE-family HTH domain
MPMNAAAKPVIDWPALIDELRARGFTSAGIADQCGVSATTIKEWRQGIKSPLYATGEALVAFWCQFTGKTPEQLPRVTY